MRHLILRGSCIWLVDGSHAVKWWSEVLFQAERERSMALGSWTTWQSVVNHHNVMKCWSGEKHEWQVLLNAYLKIEECTSTKLRKTWSINTYLHCTKVQPVRIGQVTSTMWVASPWGFSEMTIHPARQEYHACCLLRAGFLTFQPVVDNTRGTRVEQVVSSFQKILRGSQLTWYRRSFRNKSAMS